MEEIQILISSFKGFSKHTGKSKLTDKLLEIGSYTNGRIIEKIRALVRDGKKEEAALVKKQLKGSTLSATYKERNDRYIQRPANDGSGRVVGRGNDKLQKADHGQSEYAVLLHQPIGKRFESGRIHAGRTFLPPAHGTAAPQ